MLNRRHIRVKILQILYSQNRSKSTIKELYDFFNSTTKKFYQFFITQLHFFVLIKQETRRRVEINKKKYYESKIDFLVDFIIENKFIKAIEDSKYIEKYITKNEINYFKNDIKIVEQVFDKIYNAEFLKNSSKDTDPVSLLIKIYKELIVTDSNLHSFYEDCEIGWVDDFPLINTEILNMLKNFSRDEKLTINKTIFKDKDDKIFGWNLFKRTSENHLIYENLISKYTPQWESDRIAVIDSLLLKMCITEFKFFENIPYNVSLNEYVEISKDYSSMNSSSFINGILNNIMKDLKDQGLIKKNIKRSDNLLNLSS
ncbi:transcription antitermination protein NusB [Flavobacteriales bacterium]|nr:transcription antitermination protein NusB [Flavobacteriales bacterium]